MRKNIASSEKLAFRGHHYRQLQTLLIDKFDRSFNRVPPQLTDYQFAYKRAKKLADQARDHYILAADGVACKVNGIDLVGPTGEHYQAFLTAATLGLLNFLTAPMNTKLLFWAQPDFFCKAGYSQVHCKDPGEHDTDIADIDYLIAYAKKAKVSYKILKKSKPTFGYYKGVLVPTQLELTKQAFIGILNNLDVLLRIPTE